MNYYDFENAFSTARMNRYKEACEGDTDRALALYWLNVKLCQQFYGIINVFEIVLRNAIDRHYSARFNDRDWIYSQLQEGGMLEYAPQRKEVMEKAVLMKEAGRYSPDRLVASVSCGFWTYMFTKVPFRLGGQSLLHVFPERAKGTAQKNVYKELQEIKRFRNRIAHHEPVCFNTEGRKCIVYTQSCYTLILKYLLFLGYDQEELLLGLEVMPDKIMESVIRL